jgi:hypothetical protein
MANTADRDLSCKELVELVPDYLEGALSAERRMRFEKHLAGCPFCQIYLDQCVRQFAPLAISRRSRSPARRSTHCWRIFAGGGDTARRTARSVRPSGRPEASGDRGPHIWTQSTCVIRADTDVAILTDTSLPASSPWDIETRPKAARSPCPCTTHSGARSVAG